MPLAAVPYEYDCQGGNLCFTMPAAHPFESEHPEPTEAPWDSWGSLVGIAGASGNNNNNASAFGR